MGDIQIFNNPTFGEIRTIVLDGQPWFVGRDIAKALGAAACAEEPCGYGQRPAAA